MLTAIVWGAAAPRSLAATLATLVPAAVDGALREVVVEATSSEARFVADQAGCRLAGDGGPETETALCKGQWLLIVRSGDRLVTGWLDVAMDHIAADAHAARLPVDHPATARWRHWLAMEPTALLLPRERVHHSQNVGWAGLARSVRGRRLRLDRRAIDRG